MIASLIALLIACLIYTGLSLFVFLVLLFHNRMIHKNDLIWIAIAPITICGWITMALTFFLKLSLEFFKTKVGDEDGIIIDIRKKP